MADTNLLVLAKEFSKLRSDVKEVLKMPVGPEGKQGERGLPGKDGKDGLNGRDGIGIQGPPGAPGRDGRDGKDGKDGIDGQDGVSVTNAYIDFDGSLVIELSDGNQIDAGFVSVESRDNIVQQLKNGALSLNELLPSQTGNANKYLKTDGENTSWDTLTGSDIDLSSPGPIGSTTPAAATFTTLTATGQTSLGGAAGSESLRVTSVASAVNYLQVAGGAGSSAPTISCLGSSATQTLTVSGRGTAGGVNLSSSGIYFAARGVSGSTTVNYLQANASVTGTEPILSAQGSDSNISLAFQSKGTGAIDLAAGSSGVNISNGGSVTAITRTGTGFGYTSFPSVAISAPTTAGGVQATASVATMVNTGSAVQSGGTGYTVGDTLTVVGGTFTAAAATLTVTSVSGSVITAATPANFGQYTVLPTNPVSVTGGTGMGATFNLTFGIGSAPSFTITNAGSGYVEQPTVTFSGGGGSGAAAYATVGNGTQIKSIGSTMSFYTPGGEQLRVADQSNTSRYIQVKGASSSGNPEIGTAAGTLVLFGGTSSGIAFYSNNYSNAQFNIAHTANAVNYVQVTGAATGGSSLVLAQGSDTNVSLALASKAGGYLSFRTNTSTEQFRVYNTTSAVNRVEITGSIANAAPIVAVAGTDTNIDLALTPKGTGLVRFGTYTAGAPTATGYISIKAANGTTYKVLVGT